ncbi:MAG: sodium-dependent transporter [Deltaproteobacteria bacterium]|jgi:neurotransmitter:Na+ symporter, NSS family|nr:sodium-dependent transporter [Deltaproteobacteria bacterium]
MSEKVRSTWNTRAGFLLAAIGSAIGLGNIWRFPYIAYKNGGGAFLIPYAVAVLVVGIPLLILEQGIGNLYRASQPMAFAKIRKKFEVFGWWPVVMVMFGIMLFYTVVLGWCINYLVFSIDLSWGADTEAFFHNSFLGITSGPFDFGGLHYGVLLGTFLVWVLVWFISTRGVRRGLELANKIAIPLLVVLMVIMMVWNLFLDGSGAGIATFLRPDASRLTDPAVWTDAFSQVFFSLSVALGIMYAYASYLGPRAAIVNNSWITAAANSSFSIFAGMVVFATLGTMAHATGVPITEVVKGGPGLAFVIYPKAISLLPFGSRIFAVLFFLSLLLAGITSAISILESFVCSAIDKFKASRMKVVTLTCVVGFFGSMIFTTGAGLYWLDIVDYFIMNFGLLTVGLIEAVIIAWIFGVEKLGKSVNAGSSWKVGRVWRYLLKYATPMVLVVLLVIAVVDNFKKPYGGYSWTALTIIGVGWIVMTILLSIFISKRRRVEGEEDHMAQLGDEGVTIND